MPFGVACKHAVAVILHLQVQSVAGVVTQAMTPKPVKPVNPSVAQPAQICCHPRLPGLDATEVKKHGKKAAEPASESAKVTPLWN